MFQMYLSLRIVLGSDPAQLVAYHAGHSVSTGREKSLMNVFEFHNPQPLPPVSVFGIQLRMFWIVHEVHQVRTLVSDPFWISDRGFRIQKPKLWNWQLNWEEFGSPKRRLLCKELAENTNSSLFLVHCMSHIKETITTRVTATILITK